jgi:hypothetical protein
MQWDGGSSEGGEKKKSGCGKYLKLSLIKRGYYAKHKKFSLQAVC